jgi:hypothetical protein
MELKAINWGVINFCLLALVIMKLEFCTPPANQATQGSDTTIVINNSYDTTLYKTNINNFKETGTTQRPVPQNVDTAKILQAFYNVHGYVSAVNDSNLTGYVVDSVSQNRILYNRFYYRLLKPTQTIATTVINKPPVICAKYRYSIGLGIFGYSAGKSISFGPEGYYQTSKYMVGGGYDVLNKGIMLRGGIVFNREK